MTDDAPRKAKPFGPIPAAFDRIDGELTIGGTRAKELVDRYGSPLFVYSRSRIDARMDALRAAMPGRLAIHYAMKANPHPDVLRHMVARADGIDIASGGELARALDAGATNISFAGPGKRDAELETAIGAGVTLNLESPNELRRALAISKVTKVTKVTPRLAVRVNPDFDLKGSGMKMGGGAKPFGMDPDLAVEGVGAILAAGADWRGFHIYAGSQSLNEAALIEAQGQTLDLAARLAGRIGAPVPELNLGGGFGIPYFPGDTPLDAGAIGSALADRFADLPEQLAGTRFAIELGRYLVGEAGVYLTRIVDRKVSHGVTFLVTDGGLHHQLAASGNFGTVIRRNYPVAVASRFDSPATENVTIVGCLCTPLDLLADNVELPRADVGDVVALFCAGAYGATASPAAFLSQGAATEILVD